MMQEILAPVFEDDASFEISLLRWVIGSSPEYWSLFPFTHDHIQEMNISAFVKEAIVPFFACKSPNQC